MLASQLTETTYTDTKPLHGSNFYKIKAVVDNVESGYTASAVATLTDNGMESGVYLGIIGFNNDLYRYPIMKLDETTVDGYIKFIEGLTSEDQTLLYWSVEEALNTLQSAQYPSDLSEVALITFTDGLDRGSHRMTDKYWDEEDGDLAYRNDLQKRIENQTVAGKEISAYSIGLLGQDINTPKQRETFKDNIRKLASADTNAYMVENMAAVNEKFKIIAERLNKRKNLQTIKLRIPPAANNASIRFTFDNKKSDGSKSNVYIEGKFNIRTNSLENITYHGLTSATGSTLKGETDSNGNITYTFTKIVTDNGFLITPEATHEHIFVIAGSYWDPNSEFGKDGDVEVLVEKSSAAVMMVLDCTTSLGENFENAPDNVKDSSKAFIKAMYDATGSDPYNPETPPTYDDDKETYTVKGISFNMIKVEEGTYQMGSNNGYSNEKPVHSESVYSFRIGETEVTQKLWLAVMGSNPSVHTGDENFPVENVSFEDCQTFISRLNDLTGKQFRLPSEVEWEFAARGGNLSHGYLYSGSDNINDVAWHDGNSLSQPHPVAQKLPNELGLYDMSGNVWEWTSDWYSANYNTLRICEYRVRRGGSWYANATCSRVTYRAKSLPNTKASLFGLRLAL